MFLASLALPFHTWFDLLVPSQLSFSPPSSSPQSIHNPLNIEQPKALKARTHPPPTPITWHPLHVQYLVSPRFRDPHLHIPHASIPAQPASSAHHSTCRAWVGVASEPLSLVICFLNSAVPVVPRKEPERRTPTPLGDGPERRAARQQSTRSVPASSPLQPWRHGVAWHVKVRYLRRSTSYGGGMHVR